MCRKILVIIYLLLFIPAAGKAQRIRRNVPPTDTTIIKIADPIQDMAGADNEPWTLKRCIEHAKANNIKIKRQELSQQDAELANRQSKLDFIPSLNMESEYNVSYGRVLDPTTYQFFSNNTISDFNTSATVSADIFAGLKKHYTLKRSELDLRSTLFNIEKAKNDLALNVTAAYLEILFYEERIKITDDHIEMLSSQEEQTSRFVREGQKTIGDLLQIQAQLAEAEHQSILTYGQRMLAYFNLCQLLEIEDYHNFNIVAPEELVLRLETQPDAEAIIEAAQNLPQISAAQLQIEVADKDIQIARAAMYPVLNLSGGYGSSYSNIRKKNVPDPNNPSNYVSERYPFNEQVKDNANTYISLNLTIPVFNSLSAKNKVRSAGIARHRAEYDYMLAQKQLGKDIQQALINARSALEQYYSAIKNVRKSEEAFRVVEEHFRQGSVSAVDYGVALYNLTNSHTQLAQAKYEYIFKNKVLDFYNGIPLDLR